MPGHNLNSPDNPQNRECRNQWVLSSREGLQPDVAISTAEWETASQKDALSDDQVITR